MRALILWSDPSAPNFGVAALAEGAAALLRSVDPEVHVEFATFGGGSAAHSVGTRAAVKDLVGVDRSLSHLVASFDVVFDTGAGDSFADIYGLPRLLNIINAQRLAARQGSTVVLGPQTIGPFDRRLSRRVARSALMRADIVMSRDSVSTGIAHNMAGRDVVATTDLVFQLPVEQPDTPSDVIVNVSGLLWRGSRHVDSERYRAGVRELCRGLRERGRDVTLLPHVLSNSSTDDDTRILAEINPLADRVAVPTSLVHARRIIAGARLVIGSRMHCCLNALSQGVPSIPWAYSRKFAPLLSDLGWDLGVDLASGARPAAATFDLLEQFTGEDLAERASRTMERGRSAVELASESLREGLARCERHALRRI